MTKTNHAFAYRWLHPLWCGPRFVFPLFLMILCLLTACESNSTREKLPPPPEGTSTRIESPNATETGTNTPLTIAPMPSGTGDGTIPPASDQPGSPQSQNGATPAPMGLRADQLFADEVKDPDQRMARLERAVTDMRRELDANMPAVQRLVTIEGDLQELVRQLQTLMVENNTTPTMGQIQPMPTDSSGDPLDESATVAPQQSGPDVLPPVPPQNMAPEPQATIAPLAIKPQTSTPEPNTKTAAPAAAEPSQPQHSSAPKITDKITPENIRIGRHTDKTRIVIDSAAPLTMTDDMDPIEKLLVLDIEGADITTAQKTPAPNDLIAGIALRNTGPKMGQAVFELKKAVKIQRITTLPPGPNQPNYRTIIDMEK